MEDESCCDENPCGISVFGLGTGRGRGLDKGPVSIPEFGLGYGRGLKPLNTAEDPNVVDNFGRRNDEPHNFGTSKNRAEPGRMMGVRKPTCSSLKTSRVQALGHKGPNRRKKVTFCESVEVLYYELQSTGISFRTTFNTNSYNRANIGTVAGAQMTSRTFEHERPIVNENTGCGSVEYLPKDKYTKVRILSKINCLEYWAIKISSQETLTEIMARLNDGTDESTSIVPQFGLMCAALYEGLWYRGKITSLMPYLKVNLIDFGNEETCMFEHLRSIQEDIKLVPALAMRIRLANRAVEIGSSLQDGEIISVKPAYVLPDGSTAVHVRSEFD